MTAILFWFKSRLGRTFAVFFALALAFPLSVTTAAAQQIGIIRDAEIEGMIRDFATPLLKAAGLRVVPKVYVVADRSLNAFVIEDGSVFVNYGTLIEVADSGELKAILAHEIGHVAGGHLSRLRQQADTNAVLQGIAMVLGAGAIVAGGGGQIGGIATAFILASQSAGNNALLAYRRSEESNADAAALKYLEATGQSGRGMVEVLNYLKREEAAGYSPYVRTHPDASTRINQVESAARSLSHWPRKSSATDDARLAMARAKVIGFLESRTSVINAYPNSDKSLPGRLARVITAYKSGAGVTAIPVMADLAASAPNNPYFQELLGQMYFETGDAQKALGPLARAVKMAPNEPLIRVLYGRVLAATNTRANIEEAVLQLKRAVNEDPEPGLAYFSLSSAYAALGDKGEASLAAAEVALINGQTGTAVGLARQAQGNLKQGSPSWLRADDILALAR